MQEHNETMQQSHESATPSPQSFDRVLLIGHGSPDPQGNAEYLESARLLAEQLQVTVEPCFLELAEPSIAQGIQQCVEAGAQHVAVLPLFLGAAGHQKNDVPVMVQEAREHEPDITFRYGTPIGAQYPVVVALADRVTEALATSGTDIPSSQTAVILVGRGSSDPDSNSEVFKLSRLLWEGRDYGWVEVAFQTVTRPQVASVIDRCVRLGARRVVVVPYLLFTGFVRNDIEQQVMAVREHYAGVEVLLARHLANHAGVIDAIAQRYQDMRDGTATMTCDICKYRHRMTGFARDYGKPQEAHHHHGHGHHHGHDHHGHGHHHGHDHHEHGNGHGHHHGHDHQHDHDYEHDHQQHHQREDYL